MNSRILIALILLAGLGRSSGEVVFSDGFEAATIDAFWSPSTINASIVPQSTGPVHSGSKAVQFTSVNWGQKTAILSHTFPQAQYGTASVWFYDQLEYIYFSLNLSNSSTGDAASVNVQDWDSADYYSSIGNNNIRTNVPRSVGWHHAVIEFNGNLLKISIDGQVVGSAASGKQFDRVALQMTGPGWGGLLFDDFLFESAALPHLVIEQPSGTPLVSAASRDFGNWIVRESQSLPFTIRNTGQSALVNLTGTFSGTHAADFSMTPIPSELAVGASADFTVHFTPHSGGGAKSAMLQFSSNDPNPFHINLTGFAVASSDDRDGDGMNDAAEFKLSAMGFDWQLNQAELVSTYFATAQASGLATHPEILARHADVPLLTINPLSGDIKLTIGIEKSTNLIDFSPAPMTPTDASINEQGEVEYRFTPHERAAFFRLKTK